MAESLFTYPVQWIDRWQLANGLSVTVRPVLPQDGALERDFVAHQMSPRSRYQRFMIGMRDLPLHMANYFTHIDYEDHFALVAETFDAQGHRQVGDARFVRMPGQQASAEFALAVADDWHGLGLGRRLLNAVVSAAQVHGVQDLYGDVLRDNAAMLALAQRCGFTVQRHPEESRLLRVVRPLAALAVLPVPLALPTDKLPPANDGAWAAPAARAW